MKTKINSSGLKKLWLLTALALSACAPNLTQTPADPGGAKLTLMQKDGSQIVGFEAGTQEARAVKFTLTGVGLAVNDPSCTAQDTQLVCDVGTVPAGRTYVLPARGLLLTKTDYQRSDGRAYSLETDGSPE
jgi:hypothetical protein